MLTQPAIELLRAADSGMYLAPLRLLALECTSGLRSAKIVTVETADRYCVN